MKLPKGIHGHVAHDVFFTESTIPKQTPLKHLSVDIHRQNSNLEEVKQMMAAEAKALGANAVMNFKYGQHLYTNWQVIRNLRWEIEYWHGEGDAIEL